MMDDYKNSDNFNGVEGSKLMSPRHSHPTNGVGPSDSVIDSVRECKKQSKR